MLDIISFFPGSSVYLSYKNPAGICRNILFNLNETVAPDNQFNPKLAIIVIEQNYQVHLNDSWSRFNFVNMFNMWCMQDVHPFILCC